MTWLLAIRANPVSDPLFALSLLSVPYAADVSIWIFQSFLAAFWATKPVVATGAAEAAMNCS